MILITGAHGQLGSELKEILHPYKNPAIFCDVASMDITDMDSINRFVDFGKIEVDAIINCAAYTAVDRAETEQKKAFNVNSLGAMNIAKFSAEINAPLIHISTDFVFDGAKDVPYTENDSTNPLSIYGQSKLMGEAHILENSKTAIILRTSWLYSSYGNNFVKTILNLSKQKDKISVVNDQIGTPTYAHDLAKTILSLIPKIKKNTKEILHYSNDGTASWYDFAQEITSFKENKTSIIPIPSTEFPLPASRPAFSVLDKSKIKNQFDIIIPNWKASLQTCLEKIS